MWCSWLGLTLLSFVHVVVVNGIVSYGIEETLVEPERIDLAQNSSSVTLYARLCQYMVSNGTYLTLNFTRVCHCMMHF